MAKEFEMELPGGSLYYEYTDIESMEGTGGTGDKDEYSAPAGSVQSVRITRFQGLAGEVSIPAQIGGKPVLVIGKKAFLSKKNLRKVTLPSCIRAVEDWAFAYCANLHTVEFAAQEADAARKADAMREADAAQACNMTQSDSMGYPEFGKSVFMECGKLSRLCLPGADEAASALLAAAVTTAEAAYLLDAREVGSDEWLAKWDARMTAILRSADDEGYSKQILCGEEDYGSTDLAAYEGGQRKRKVRLLLLRCLYPVKLSDRMRGRMERYLREHTKGCEHDETWQVILREHGEDRRFYELFAALGCITEENLEGLLADAGGDYPELSAFLLRYKEDTFGSKDFFSGLEL